MNTCIWCKQPITEASEEHVIPDALGCPSQMILRDGVCQTCNNGLGHVDQALIRQFEIPAFISGARRKGNKPPAINMWSAVQGRHVNGEPQLHLNAGPQPVDSMGRTLHAAKASNGIMDVAFDRPATGEEATISFKQEFGREPKLRRALYKVGLGVVALDWGLDAARDTRFDPIRDFVRYGWGSFDALMVAGRSDIIHYVELHVEADELLPQVEISLFGIGFQLDLSGDQSQLFSMRDRVSAEGKTAWMLPHL